MLHTFSVSLYVSIWCGQNKNRWMLNLKVLEHSTPLIFRFLVYLCMQLGIVALIGLYCFEKIIFNIFFLYVGSCKFNPGFIWNTFQQKKSCIILVWVNMFFNYVRKMRNVNFMLLLLLYSPFK